MAQFHNSERGSGAGGSADPAVSPMASVSRARSDKSGRRPRHTSQGQAAHTPLSFSPVSGPPTLRLVGPRRPEPHDYFKEMVDDILGT